MVAFFHSSSSPAVPGACSPCIFDKCLIYKIISLFPLPHFPFPYSWQPPTVQHLRHLSAVCPAHVHGWLLGNKSRLSVNHVSKETHESCSCLPHINSHLHEYRRPESLGQGTDFGPSHWQPWTSGEVGRSWREPLANWCLWMGRRTRFDSSKYQWAKLWHCLLAFLVCKKGPARLHGSNMVANYEYQRIPDFWRKGEFLHYHQGWDVAQR